MLSKVSYVVNYQLIISASKTLSLYFKLNANVSVLTVSVYVAVKLLFNRLTALFSTLAR